MSGRILRGTLQVIGLIAILSATAVTATLFFLSQILQVDEQIDHADYILPLAGDLRHIVRAAELYRGGLAPTVLLSLGDLPPTRISRIFASMGHPPLNHREFLPKMLERLGVPATAVEPFSDEYISTVEEEAETLKRHLGGRRASIILVSSPYHTRRARMIFERTLPEVNWLIAATPEGRLPVRWWASQDTALTAVQEAVELLHYWTGSAFRAGNVQQDKQIGGAGER